MIKKITLLASVALLSSCGNTIIKDNGSNDANVVVIEDRNNVSTNQGVNTDDDYTTVDKGTFLAQGIDNSAKVITDFAQNNLKKDNILLASLDENNRNGGGVAEKTKAKDAVKNSVDKVLLDRLAKKSRVEALKNTGVAFVLYFKFDGYTIDEQTIQEIVKHANFMNDNTTLKLRLEGHADERGTREYNLALAENRALAVKEIFELYGLSSRVEVVSFGEESPEKIGHNEGAWQKNRRVEFIYR
jgi:peptidoglycan-associated lipoprotein